MTKKIFAMFLAVLMVVSMLPTSVFAAEACPGATATHSLKNCADYTAVYTKPANCGEGGFTTYQCNKCKATFVDSWTDPVGEHVMVPAAEEDNVPAYCGKEGAKGGLICSVCKKHREGQEVIPAIGEKGVTQCEFPVWEVVEKDCTEEFELTVTCLNCTFTKTLYKHELEENVEHKHAYGEWELVTPATADAPGKAVRKCTHGVKDLWSCNATEEQEVFFAHEHDEHTLLKVDAVPYTCETAGVAEHYECRICGKLFKDGKEVTLEDLKVASYHDQLKADKTKLNCKNTSMVCDNPNADCDEIIRIDINQAHTYGDWTVPAGSNATCLLDGYRTRKCSLCDHVETDNIPALGHIEAEYTVKATCSQYEYTFTYCLRDGCTLSRVPQTTKKNGETPVSFDVNVGSAVLSEPTANLGFYLQFNQANLGKVLYFDGKTAKDAGLTNGKDYYMNSTDDITKAVLVYLEVASDDGINQTYRMYFYKDNDKTNDKTYISIYKSGTYINAKISADVPTTTWAWNAENGILTTKIDNTEYCFTMYNEYATFGASKISYLETSFGSEMLVVNGAEGVKLLDIVPNFAAGKNPEAHKLEIYSQVASTCLVAGTKIEICSLCKTVMPAETLPKADHVWVDDGDDTTVNVTMDCLTDGKEYQKCSVCGAKNVKTTAASGHDYKEVNGQIFVGEYKGDHKNIITYKFNICTDPKCPLLTQKDHNKQDLKDTENGGARVIIEDSIGAWSGAGKVYKDEAAAKADHPGFAITATNALPDWNKNATCTVAGYEAFDCPDCDNTVLIKSWKEIDAEGKTITHTDFEAQQQKADCHQEGGYYTYECACGEKVGKGEVDDWNKTADKLDHDWKDTKNYEAPKCDEPDYTKVVKTCQREGCGEKVYAMTNLTPELDYDNLLCDTTYFEYYYCYKCDDTHMRSFVSKLGHEWVDVGTPTAPTCTKPGHQDKVCKWCEIEADKVDAALEVIPMVPHKNAAGDEFWANCKDKTVDRHCVVCCKACGHKEGFNCLDADGKAETKDDYCEDCYYPALNHVYGDWIYVEDTCEELPYKYHICTVCFDTPAAEFIDEIKVGEDEKGNDIMEDVVVGHRPVAVDEDKNGKEIYYGQYKYEDYKDYAVYNWVVAVDAEGKEVLDENGKALKVLNKTMMPGYEAKYIEYTAPTYTTAGSAKFLCACCNEIVEVELPAISGLGFELEINNANGDKEFTYGSLVEVVVYANGNNVAFNSFNFNLNFANIPVLTCKSTEKGHEHGEACYELLASDLVYVYSDKDSNKNFNITTSAAANGYIVNVLGTAVRNESGKLQNITINGKTELVKLYFRINTMDKKDIVFNFSDARVGEIKAGQTDPTEKKDFTSVSEKMSIRKFLDFNNDGHFSLVDLMLAESMMTFEHPDGKTYDVTLDINKDGEVTPEELTIAYNFFVGNYKPAELLVMGMTEAEIALMGLNHKVLCNNPECRYELNADWNRCPICGNYQ